MKPDTWMPWFIGDYLADTMHLTTAQHGGYLLLIAAYWRNGGPLPASPDHLSTIAKATRAEWFKIAPVLSRFFEMDVVGGRTVWRHKRIDKELTAASKRQARAQAGARARHEQASSKPQADAEQPPSTCSTAAPLPLPSSHPSDGGAKPRRSRKVKALLPEGWQPSESLQTWAKTHEPMVDWQRETERFRDHYSQQAMLDWDATWRNWLRKARDFARAKTPAPRLNGTLKADPDRREAEIAKQLREREEWLGAKKNG